MTIFQIILIVAASIFIGIPLYLFIGKVGREIVAITMGVFEVILRWDSKRFQKTYDEVLNCRDALTVTKIFYPVAIILFAFLSILAFVIRLGWLTYLAVQAGARFYWKSLKYCWE